MIRKKEVKCSESKSRTNQEMTTSMTTTTRMMERMMKELLVRMSEVFGRDEEEVSEAVKEEMKGMMEAYKVWLSVCPGAGVKKEKVPKEKKPKAATKVKSVVKAAEESTPRVESDTVEDLNEGEVAAAAVVEEPKPKAVPKKKAEAKEGEEPKPKAVPKKKAEAKEGEEPKPKAAPKKKAEAKEGEEPKPKAAPKKKAEAKEGEEPKATPKKAPKKKEEAVVVVEVTKEDEEEEVEVEEIEYDGVKYLKSTTGVVYDIMTSEEIGRWNAETNRIDVD